MNQKTEMIPPFSGSRMGYAVAFSTQTFSSLAGFLDGVALNGSPKVAQFGVWSKAKLSLLIIKTQIGLFRVALSLCFIARPSAKTLVSK